MEISPHEQGMGRSLPLCIHISISQRSALQVAGYSAVTPSHSNSARCLLVMCIVFNDKVVGKMRSGFNSACFDQVNHLMHSISYRKTSGETTLLYSRKYFFAPEGVFHYNVYADPCISLIRPFSP